MISGLSNNHVKHKNKSKRNKENASTSGDTSGKRLIKYLTFTFPVGSFRGDKKKGYRVTRLIQRRDNEGDIEGMNDAGGDNGRRTGSWL